MRPLDATILKLKRFSDDNTPSYAVLPHRWSEEEVSLQGIQCPDSRITTKVGYSKIKSCAEQALSQNIEWEWAETCRIDKSSSAEHSEVINSMYKIYQRAEVHDSTSRASLTIS